MATPFRPALDLLVQYAAYHRDERNIATHFVGVPLIVFAVGVLLARPLFALGPLVLTPAWVACVLAVAWYLTRGELALGIATSAAVALLVALGQPLGAATTGTWLSWGLGCFAVGWIVQFVGHYYEGRKPAFADDVAGLLVGPMFVTLELLALAGRFRPLLARVEGRAGPPTLRDLAHPVG